MSLCPTKCRNFTPGIPFRRGTDCYLCHLEHHDARYRSLFAYHPNVQCVHLGPATGATERCPTCSGSVNLKVFECSTHGRCTLGKKVDGVACCAVCPDKKIEPDSPSLVALPIVTPRTPTMKWQYGVTTCQKRVDDGMCRATLESLARAGFDRPFLFADGVRRPPEWTYQYEVISRSSPARTAANWVLALYELWARDSTADRFAVFQDDFVTYPNLREYLDSCHYPEKGYWNLYTFPVNQNLAPKSESGGTLDGWFRANQLGKGAVALVFDRDAVRSLLGQDYLVDRFLSVDADPRNPGTRRCDRSIDGGIVEALKRRGWTEWCHSPSLVQHAGIESSMGNRVHRLAESFRGEDYDALELIEKRV